MYTNYFGLKEKPFSIAPDPRYLYMSERHREALAHLLYGLNSDGCLILLTGDVGTGKTTVCRSLLEQLPENTDIAIILNPKLTVQELLETMCEELEIAFEKNSVSIKPYIDALNGYLLKSNAQGRTTVLIIDEAQNLEMDVLEQLRMLTNLETDKHKLLKIILIGQPELQRTLEHPAVSQINQRITSRYHLGPLSRSDVYAFIQHRLIIAGGGRMQFFTEKALKRVHQLSKGIPRLINVLCDRALLGAYVEETDQVTEKIMLRASREVLGEIELPEEKESAGPKSLVRIVILAILLFFLGTTIYLYSIGPDKMPFIQQLTGSLPWVPNEQDNATATPRQMENSQQHSPQETVGIETPTEEPDENK